jgi:hypothetical protein
MQAIMRAMKNQVPLSSDLVEVLPSPPEASVEHVVLSAERAERARELLRLHAEQAKRFVTERRG